MKTTTRQITGYFATYFFLGATNAILGPALPDIANNVGVGLAQVGLLISLKSFGFLIGSLICGWLYDLIPGNTILAVSVLVLSLLQIFIPGLSVFLILSIIVFITGIVQGGMDVGANIMLINTDAAGMQRLLNGLYFIAGAGGFLAPAVLGFTSLSLGFTGISILMIPLSIWLFLTPSPVVNLPEVEQMGTKLNVRVFWLFAALAFFLIGLEVGYGSWIFTYFSEKGFGSNYMAYWITSAFWLAMTLGRLVTIVIASRIETARRVFAYFGLVLTSVLIILLKIDAIPALWVGTIGLGLGLSSLFPTLIGYLQEKTKLSGKLSGVVWSMGSFGAMVIPWLIGQRIDTIGPNSMMNIISLAVVLAIISFVLIYCLRKQSNT